MGNTAGYTGPVDLVYQVNEDSGGVVFADREKALYVAQIYEALDSKTWGEFRAKLPAGGWQEFVEHWSGEDEEGNLVDDFPDGSAPFDGCYMETGYPEWLANTAVYWFPKDLVEKYGGWVDHNMASDDSLWLPGDQAEEIADDLRALGCTVEPSPVDLI